MSGWNIIFFIWFIVAMTMEMHCWYMKKHQRYKWNRRQDGLLSFSNKQFLLMRWLWPITLFCFIFTYFILLFVGKIVGIYKRGVKDVD